MAFFDELMSKKVAVIGLGVSHNDLIEMMLQRGISLALLDKRSKEEIGAEAEVLAKKGVQLDLGESYLDSLTQYDVVFRAPGVYFNKPELVKAREQGVVITSEMEVFFDLCPCPILAVTGSDGKTTTSTLISEMLKAEGKTVHLGGNIGKPLLYNIDNINPTDFCVVELSSFQLISMRKSPHVAVITNISPNHLNVHKDMEEYVGSKVNLISHQDAFSKTVLNLDNQPCFELCSHVRGTPCYFTTKPSGTMPYNGSYLDEQGNLCLVKSGKSSVLFSRNEIKLPGIHNVENYLAAIAAVEEYVKKAAMLKVAQEFGGVEHRLEFVKTVDGVKYYNDSIATSPTSTIAALNAFPTKPIIIAGGYDKKIPYTPLAPFLIAKAKALILLGATAHSIEEAVKNCPDYATNNLQMIRVETMEQAVNAAQKIAVFGDIVSLSPASASFDLYQNFEQRGKHFKKIVNELQKQLK